jgi:hypothetical protein
LKLREQQQASTIMEQRAAAAATSWRSINHDHKAAKQMESLLQYEDSSFPLSMYKHILFDHNEM